MLDIKNLSSGYNDKKIIEGITLSIPKNSFVAVVGPNGSGKSTFLKTLGGIIPKTEGEILLDSREISELSGKGLAKEVSYLAQSRNIPDMTVKQLVLHGRFPYLDYPRRYKETDRKIAKEAMKKMGISDMADRLLTTLSGGERQKAYIAMALSQDTDYILLDEPTTYLDISYQLNLMEILKNLSQNGKGIISVMHDLPLALNFADYVMVISDGSMIAFDSPEKVCDILPGVFGVRLNNIDGQYNYDIF